MNAKTRHWIERGFSVLLSLVFLVTAGAKFAGDAMIVETFQRFGLPGWFMLLTATIEILGAVGLHFRKSLAGTLSLAMLLITMLAALSLHLLHDPMGRAIPAAVLAALCATVLVMRRTQNHEPSHG